MTLERIAGNASLVHLFLMEKGDKGILSNDINAQLCLVCDLP